MVEGHYARIEGKSIQQGLKGRCSPLEEAITMNAVVLYWNLILYCIPVAFVALVLPRCALVEQHTQKAEWAARVVSWGS